MLSGISNKWAMSSLFFRNVLWQVVKKVCVTSGLHLIEKDRDTEAMERKEGDLNMEALCSAADKIV